MHSIGNIRRSALAAGLTAAALALSTLVAAPARAADPIDDPVTEMPTQSRLGLVLTEYASFPQSFPTPAPTDQRLMRTARINTIMELPDRSGRRAVPDLNGKLYLVEDGVPHVYLDVAATFAPQFFSGRGLGQGFGYVAFHPEFGSNGRFYTIHTEQASATTEVPDYAQSTTLFHGVITEWTATDPAADTFAGSRREILRIGFGGQIHGVQEINFNPTAKRHDSDYGLLYLAVGDGGLGVRNTDPQNLAMPHGKLLRIDPRGSDSANGQYGIPASNPFVGRAGALGEIYAVGFRDPHRFSWDRATGRMYLGHIGEHAVEAIYEVRAGDNFGWSEREGAYVFDKTATNPCDKLLPLPADDADHGYTYPVAAYDHDPAPGWNCASDVGVAVAGGFVYRGRELPALRGKYVFGDLVDGRVLYTEANKMRRGAGLAPIHRLALFDAAGNPVRMQDLSGPGAPGDPNRVDLRFGTDAAGELYILAKANGKVWKVTGTRVFAAGDVGDTRLRRTAGAHNWAPVTPSKWQFTKDEVILAEAGESRPGPRRPFEYAVLTAGPAWSSVEVEARVRLDTPVEITNRDVIIVFGWRSDTEFYYAHLSTDHTIYPHNGIFKVDNADRERIDHQWNGRSRGANPAITDADWHKVRVKHLPATGEIAVYVDGHKDPLMTAKDTTFGFGRVGFGSFDNVGRLRHLTVTGTPA
ncbi:Glucose/arabinose dehydrogenase, beta-propeller fold [Micromonospora echinaurantiaca]|uniref:Glucose/arabinose dehydrogenase, beta-propeller fold n=1 Tax=Micromonospora echinaurantiaca TaxID=47857 RepID=A0A1C5IEW5_9ACTN|nr:PQQ-dependent sugar dehydrogenase [Micromonospora echinaurantiaca]SCG56715.1 Glucose/arabinose dehydrogenase, beta-propeller fold [Micromonospora echinaurantiaca]